MEAVPLIRWSARIFGLALFLFILAFLIGEGPPPFSAMSAAFLVAWLGLIVVWPWELVGGLMVVGGMAAFFLISALPTGNLPGFWFKLWFLPGLLSLVSWWMDKRQLLLAATPDRKR